MLTQGTQIWLKAAAAIVILAGFKLAAPLIVPLLLALFLAIVSAPSMFALIRRGLPSYASVGIALLANLAVFVAMGALGAGSLNAFARSVPRYQARVAVLIGEGSSWLVDRGLPGLGEVLPRVVDYNMLGKLAADGLAGLAGVLSTVVLVWLVVAFLLVEALGIEVKLQHVLAHPADGIRRVRRAAEDVQRYILAKTATNLFTALLVWAWLAMWRVEFALLWALSAFMVNYIPTLGAMLLAAPVLLITLLQHGVFPASVVGLGYVAINMLVATVIEPRVFGQVLGMSPLVVFISMVCWGWLWGPVGALLSVPLTMVVQIVAAYLEGYQWLSVLLGPADPKRGRRSSLRPPAPSHSDPQALEAARSHSDRP